MVHDRVQVPQTMVETSQRGIYNIGVLDCGEVRVLELHLRLFSVSLTDQQK